MTWLEFKVFGKHKLRNLRFDLTFLRSMPSMLLFLLFLSLYSDSSLSLTHTHTHPYSFAHTNTPTRFTHKLTNKHRLSFSHTLTDTLTHASLLKFIGAFHKRFFFLWGSYRRNTAMPSLLSLSHYCAFKLSLTHALTQVFPGAHTLCMHAQKGFSQQWWLHVWEPPVNSFERPVHGNAKCTEEDSCACVCVCVCVSVCVCVCVRVCRGCERGWVCVRERVRENYQGGLSLLSSFAPFQILLFPKQNHGQL